MSGLTDRGSEFVGELAIKGGNPVRSEPFPAWPEWDTREEDGLLGVLRSGVWGALEAVGSRVAQFEAAFAKANGARYCLCVSSGSSALQAALRAAVSTHGYWGEAM